MGALAPRGVRRSFDALRKGPLFLVPNLLVAVLLVMPTLVGPSSALPKLALPRSALSSGTTLTPPFAPNELWGGGNLFETCSYCKPTTMSGLEAPPSTDPGKTVDSDTGDMSESYTLFSMPAVGANLGFTLTYDAQAAQYYAANNGINGNGYPGAEGWGWRDNYTSGVVDYNNTYVVTEPNGSTVSFDPDSGTCSPGETEKTVLGSNPAYCAAYRVNRKLRLRGSRSPA